jgi:hypothetical protein
MAYIVCILEMMNWMQGYVLGDPATVPHDDYNSRIPFAHRKTLISDELYKVNFTLALKSIYSLELYLRGV